MHWQEKSNGTKSKLDMILDNALSYMTMILKASWISTWQMNNAWSLKTSSYSH